MCPQREVLRPGYTERCVQNLNYYSCTTPAHEFKTFQSAQLALLVISTNVSNHKIVYTDHGRLVLNVGFSLRSAHTSSQSGSHLNYNELFHRLCLLFCGLNMYCRNGSGLNKVCSYCRCGTRACYSFWTIHTSAINVPPSFEKWGPFLRSML